MCSFLKLLSLETEQSYYGQDEYFLMSQDISSAWNAEMLCFFCQRPKENVRLCFRTGEVEVSYVYFKYSWGNTKAYWETLVSHWPSS